MRRSHFITLLSLAVFCILIQHSFADQQIVGSILETRQQNKPFELPSTQISGLTLEKAYELQKQYAEALQRSGEGIAGFKAALTTEAAQKKLGTDRPLIAPLFTSGMRETGTEIDMGEFQRLVMEQEIGFVVRDRINKPVENIDELKNYIKAVMPVVEVPDLRYADMKNLKAADLVVDAVSSAKYILGKSVPYVELDLNEIQVNLTKDGSSINSGKGSEAMGDQWKALLWLVNAALAKGHIIEPGQILITGAIGKMIPGKPGAYHGDWGKLGLIDWTVK